MLVLTLLVAFLHPEIREHLLDLQRQETGENRVAGILGSRRQDRGILLFGADSIALADERLDGLPLVIAEVIYHAQQHFLSLVEQGEDSMLHQVMRHDGTLAAEPTLIVLGDPFGEGDVGLRALVLDKRTHRGVLKFDIPFAERALDSLPFLDSAGGVDHIGDIAPFLAVVLLHLLADNRLLMHMFLEAHQDLTRVDGFDEVVGDLLADSLLHDMFLFGLGDHHYRHFGVQALHLLERLETRHSRHVLIQEYDSRHRLRQAI